MALTSRTTIDNEEMALQSLFDRFGFVLSLEVIRSTFCKAGQDADLAGELLSELQTDPSEVTPHVSNGSVNIGTSKVSDNNGFIKPCYANGNYVEKASRMENNYVPRGTLGKEYVWRARAEQDANLGDISNVSNRSVNSETVSKSSNDNDFGNSCYANGNSDKKTLESKKAFVSKGTFGTECVWRARASGALNVPLASISQGYNGSVKSETSSSSSDGNGCIIRPSYANGNSDEKALRSQSNSVSRGITRKECVWRAKVGQDVPNNCVPMDRNSQNSGDDNAFNSNSSYTNANDDSKLSKLKKDNDSIVVVLPVRAREDANLSDSCGSIDTNSQKSCDENAFNNNNSISGYTQLMLKNNSASLDRVSSIPGKDYVWRPKVQDANLTGEKNSFNDEAKSQTSKLKKNNDSTVVVLPVRAREDANLSDSCGSIDTNSQKSCDENAFNNNNNNSSYTQLRLKNNSASLDRVSSVPGKDYVWRPKVQDANLTGRDCAWRVRTNGIPNGENISKTEVNNTLHSVNSSEESLLRRDAVSSVKKDFEDFLLDTLGRGLQLEKSDIQEVLGNCGYDIKKSLETVLDLAARTLDRRNGFHKGNNFNSNLSQNNERIQELAESGNRKTRYSRILSGPSNERHEQPKEGLTKRSEVIETMVSEPQEDIAEDYNDEAKDDSYQILRKIVQEYRDTAKDYYKAAVEAYKTGNHAESSVLLEKGQSLSNMAREADEQSAEKIFVIRDGEMHDDMYLDLRHHDAKEAVRLVKCYLRSLPGNSFNLKIVVGIGFEDVEKRKRLIIKLLEREAIEWIEDEQTGTIAIRLDKINPKSLIFARR